jgi:hypothetical protein
LCYAKITPAALHCGDFNGRCRNGVEAVGRKPKFEVSGSLGARAGAAPAVVRMPRMASS